MLCLLFQDVILKVVIAVIFMLGTVLVIALALILVVLLILLGTQFFLTNFVLPFVS